MDHSTAADLEEVEDSIRLHSVWVQALGEQPPTSERDEQIAELKETLRSLSRQAQDLREQASSSPGPEMVSNLVKQAHSRPASRTSNASSSSNWDFQYRQAGLEGQSASLPTRKRPNECLGADLESRDSKSRKPTPSPVYSVAHSPASTTNASEIDIDDPLLRQILGDEWREDYRRDKEYLKSLEERRRQEQSDFELAKSLQESWNENSDFAGPSTAPIQLSSRQSYFNQNGTLSVPTAIEAALHSQPIKTESRPQSCLSQPFSLQSSPLSVSSDSSSDLQVISGTNWRPNPRRIEASSSQQYSALPNQSSSSSEHSMSMPGAFPGEPNAGNIGGTFVYGNSPFLGGSSTQTSHHHRYAQSPGFVYQTHHPDFPDPPFIFGDHSNPRRDDADIAAVIANIRPDENLSQEQRVAPPPELEVELMPHQKLGFSWMLQMEKGTNKGGILADEMGLGKTIQALSLILANKPVASSPRPTLVVAPVALLHQWEREAVQAIKPRHRLRIYILHGERRKVSWQSLKMYDIVITTYGLIAAEFRRWLEWQGKRKLYPNAQPTAQEQCLLLDERTRFHRIILDEAQYVKNRNTKAALGVCRIQAEYRWCLTGTPMQNNVDEFQSLLHFTRIRPYSSWERFSREISRPLKRYDSSRDRAMRQLQAIVRATTLRRLKSSQIDGQPILQLPPKSVSETRATFSDDEKAFYQALEQQTRLQFNKYLKAGTVGRHYSNILVLLLRLRQACCHPHLIKDFGIHSGGLAGLDFVANARELPHVVVERLKEIEAFECPVCMDAVVNALIMHPCGHNLCEECLSRLVDATANGDESGSISCPSCRTKINPGKMTDHRSFLVVHCPEREDAVSLEDQTHTDESVDESSETESDEKVDNESDSDDDLRNFIVRDDADLEYDTDVGDEKPVKSEENFEDEQKLEKRVTKHKVSSKSKGKARKRDEHANKSLADLRKAGLKNKAAKKAYLRRLRKDFQTSTKIEQTMKIISDIHEQDPTEKTLVFCSFTTFLDLLEVPLSQRPYQKDYVRYDGSMSSKERTAAVEYFSDKPSCNVMLISLKAGNAGLNLTRANHVIILDPHWNYYCEAQAIDRVHRLGQSKPVRVHRLLIDSSDFPDGTVEDRIIRLQEKKKEIVENALSEDAGKNVARLGVRELGYLFVSSRSSIFFHLLTMFRASTRSNRAGSRMCCLISTSGPLHLQTFLISRRLLRRLVVSPAGERIGILGAFER